MDASLCRPNGGKISHAYDGAITGSLPHKDKETDKIAVIKYIFLISLQS